MKKRKIAKMEILKKSFSKYVVLFWREKKIIYVEYTQVL